MNKTKKLVAVATLTGCILVACSNNNNSDESTPTDNISEDTIEETEDGDSTGLPEKSDFSSDDQADTEITIGEGTTEDQLDLNIGDTGLVETSLSTYEVTLDSVEFVEELEGQESQMDTFIIADVTIKNTSEEPIEISDALNIFEVSTEAEGGGYGLRSASYEGVEEFKGELEPAQEKSGQLLYENLSDSNHFLKVREGLLEAGGVKNKATWTFVEE